MQSNSLQAQDLLVGFIRFDSSREVIHEQLHVIFGRVFSFIGICRAVRSVSTTLVERIVPFRHILDVEQWSNSVPWSGEGFDGPR